MRFVLALLLALPLQVLAQYPQRAIKMIVPFPPAGAGGSIGSDMVAKAAPDGYTILMATSSTHSIGPALQKLPYDPIKDFAAITHVADVKVQ